VAGSGDIAQAAGVTPTTIRRWAKAGLLPPGRKVHRGRRGTGLVFPDSAPAQAVWIKTQLDAGRTIEELRAALLAGEYSPPSGGES
jgi:DNA-binding transcriptional MerR regulator